MDKNHCYKGVSNSKIIDGILVGKQNINNELRINQQTITTEEYIEQARKYLNKIINKYTKQQKKIKN